VTFRAWQGCFAEKALVPAAEALPMPADFGFAEGASFTVATSTATHALPQRGRPEPGETLLVRGAAGGVGLAAVEVGKLLGATVIGTASSTADSRSRSRAAATMASTAAASASRTASRRSPAARAPT
jgi:NADPH2:quinone reductase